MLSHDEDRHLRAIEQRLETDDPELARMLRTHQPPAQFCQHRAVRIAVGAVGGTAFALGALTSVGALIVFGTMLISICVSLNILARA